MVRRIGLQQAKPGGDDVPPLQGHPGLSDASEGTGVPESRGEVGVQDPEHHDGARDTRWRDDRMTGRRSHGRLSALNGVVHQGRWRAIIDRDRELCTKAGARRQACGVASGTWRCAAAAGGHAAAPRKNHSNHRGLSRIRPALSHLGRSGIHRRLNRRVCASRRQSSRSRGEALRCCALVGSRARLPCSSREPRNRR